MKELGEWLLRDNTVFEAWGNTKFEVCVDKNKWPQVMPVLKALEIV